MLVFSDELEMAFTRNCLPALESVRIVAVAREKIPDIWGKFLNVFAKAAQNIKSVSLGKHRKSAFNELSAVDIVDITPFFANCSSLEVIILNDDVCCQMETVMKNVWEKLPNLKFFRCDSEFTKRAAKALVSNYDSLILNACNNFYFKSSLPLSTVKTFVSKQYRIHDLKFCKNHHIFTF